MVTGNPVGDLFLVAEASSVFTLASPTTASERVPAASPSSDSPPDGPRSAIHLSTSKLSGR
jgi:hypothetical protein